MEVLYSAKRLNNETSLRWFVFNDDQYSGYAITNDGERIPVSPKQIKHYYKNPVDLKFSHKVENSVARNKKKQKVTIDIPESDMVDEKPLVKTPKPPEIDHNLYGEYHKVIFSVIDDSGFEIEVDGNEDSAITLKNELSRKYKNLSIKKKIIRSVKEVIDTYTTVEHYKHGKIYFEMDFDDAKDASNMFNKRKTKYPNDDIRMYLVEEVI